MAGNLRRGPDSERMAAVKLKVVYAVAAVCASVIFWGFVAMMLLAAMRELAAGADVPPCAPVSFVFSEQAECTRLGLGPAPCSVPCGRLCYREARAEWRWMQGKNGCPRFPGATPTPLVEPTRTPRPSSTARPTPRPSPTTPCDVPGSGWCYVWSPDTDVVICARCPR